MLKSQKFGAQRIKYQLMNKVADQELINNIYRQANIDEFATAKSICYVNFMENNLKRLRKKLSKYVLWLHEDLA